MELLILSDSETETAFSACSSFRHEGGRNEVVQAKGVPKEGYRSKRSTFGSCHVTVAAGMAAAMSSWNPTRCVGFRILGFSV